MSSSFLETKKIVGRLALFPECLLARGETAAFDRGYLTNPQFEDVANSHYYNQMGVQTTKSPSHLYVEVSRAQFLELREIIESLQNKAFRINEIFLDFLKEYSSSLQEKGLLENEASRRVDLIKASNALSAFYLQIKKNEEAKAKKETLLPPLEEVRLAFLAKIEKARAQEDLLRMAEMLRGMTFYFPAFLDFRGRIYRLGQLHFHGSDLARSLLLFEMGSGLNKKSHQKRVWISTAFSYQKWESRERALSWAKDFDSKAEDQAYLFEKAKEVKEPFQLFNY